MEPYSKHSSCSKCGFNHITTEYKEQEVSPEYYTALGTYCLYDIPNEAMPAAVDYQVPEHMLRTCPNCTYSWKELPL